MDEPVELDEALTRREWRMIWGCVEPRMRYFQRRAARPKSYPDGPDAIAAKHYARLLSVIDSTAGDARVEPDEVIPLGAPVTRREWGMIREALEWSRAHYDEKFEQLNRLEPLITRAAEKDT